MQASSKYLLIGLGALCMMAVLGCCGLAAFTGSSETTTTASVAGAEVDLEKLTTAFEANVTATSQDLNGFEQTVNDKAKGIYIGEGHVDVAMQKDGEVVGFLNKNTEPTYEKGVDTMVFSLHAEPEQKRVVASDAGQRHYSYHPTGSGFFTGYLIGSMLTNQRSYYGPSGYRAPATANWVKPGYHTSLKSSYRSPSVRSGSYGKSSSSSGSRSGYRSGGSGFGK